MKKDDEKKEENEIYSLKERYNYDCNEKKHSLDKYFKKDDDFKTDNIFKIKIKKKQKIDLLKTTNVKQKEEIIDNKEQNIKVKYINKDLINEYNIHMIEKNINEMIKKNNKLSNLEKIDIFYILNKMIY